MTEGPGDGFVPATAIGIFGGLLIALAIVIACTVIAIWPQDGPQPIPEQTLFRIVLLLGAGGATLHSLRSFYWYTGQRQLKWSWMLMYFVMPVCGALLGIVVYVVLRGGLLAPSPPDKLNAFGFGAVAILAGMFSRQTVEKLKSIAETALQTAPHGKDTATATATAPVITTVSPMPLVRSANAAEITINGSGFTKPLFVMAGTQPLDVTAVNESSVRAVVKAELQKPGTELILTVSTAVGTSNAVKLPIAPGT